MKQVIKCCCFLIVLTTTSCFGSQNNNVTTINSSQKKEAKKLVLEEVPTKDRLEYARRCFVFDSILVVQNYSNSNKHLFEFVNMNTMNVVKKAITRGNGPDELIEVIARNSGKYLHIDGYMNHKYAKIDVASYINDEDGKIDYLDYKFSAQGIDLLDKNHFLVVNPYRFINKKLKINQSEPRFLILEGDEIIKQDNLLSAISINTGGIMINYNNQRISYYLKDLPEIEIYDFNLNLIRTVKGPDKITPQYSINNSTITYLSNKPISYKYACFDDSYMYLVYEGRFIKSEDIIKNGGKAEKTDTWIFKIDWEGNFKDCFLVSKDKDIKSISIAPGGVLYLCCESDGLIKLYKANLQ